MIKVHGSSGSCLYTELRLHRHLQKLLYFQVQDDLAKEMAEALRKYNDNDVKEAWDKIHEKVKLHVLRNFFN